MADSQKCHLPNFSSYILPVHFGDNGFGAAAFQNAMVADADVPLFPPSERNPLGTLGAYRITTEDARSLGFEYRGGRRNLGGYNDLGRVVLREMFARRMMIDR